MEPANQVRTTLRVLLVDDDEDDYVWIRRVLASEDEVRVDWAASYEEGCGAIRSRAHDVILVDYRLGDAAGHDGLDIVRKARDAQTGTPCVLFTGAPRAGLEVASLAAGAAGFLTKAELSKGRLTHAILQALQHGKVESELFQKNRALSLLLRATKAANEALSERQAFEACLLDVCTELGFDASCALLIAADGRASLLTVRESAEARLERLDEIRSRVLPNPDSGLLAQALRTQQPVWCRELATCGDSAYQKLSQAGLTCALLVPVIARDEVVALLELYGVSQRELEPAQTDIIVAVAAQLAHAVSRARAEAERARVEGELRLSQRMDALGRLAGGIAHDFNNLLTAISAYAELLLMLPRQERGDDSIEPIREAAQRGGRLTRQLLSLGQRNVVAPAIVDVNALIGSHEHLLRRVLPENIDFNLVISPNVGNIEIDPSEFEQLMLNLVLNARDAISGPGVLTIATSVAVREGDLAGSDPQSYVRVDVTDTGSGMSAQTRDHIFEPFFTTKETGKGSGLGLACVYGVVRRAGGVIEVDSELGSGTRFRLYFPRKVSVAADAHDREDGSSVVGGSETVLLVEDDSAVRASAALVLESYGYRVLSASGPREALTIARRVRVIDLVLTDVVMPEMNGIQLADELRKLRGPIEVLFMSGYAQAAIEAEGLVDVARRLVEKPFRAEELAARVRKALDDAAARRTQQRAGTPNA